MPSARPWIGDGIINRMPDDMFSDFRAFAPAFQSSGHLETPPYLVLLGLNRHQSEAVLIVARCLDAAENKRTQMTNLLMGGWGWRPQLVGCVAVLATLAEKRPLDALLDAVSHRSWVSPQLLATTALTDPPDWPGQVENAIIDVNDAKGAAALRALLGTCSAQLTDLANRDADHGDEIALGWRDRITAAFDAAGLHRSW